jgi:hypothetical protein
MEGGWSGIVLLKLATGSRVPPRMILGSQVGSEACEKMAGEGSHGRRCELRSGRSFSLSLPLFVSVFLDEAPGALGG